MYSSNSIPYSIAMTPVESNNGFGGEGSWVWILIILVVLFGGWGNGFGYGGGGQSTSVYEGYVLNNDFSVLSNQLGQGFATQERRTDNIINGISSLGYDQLAQMNNIGTSILTSTNGLQAAIKDCCCQTQQNIADVKYTIGATGSDLNYNIATQSNGIQNAISNGFCQTNFNAQTNTRDIVDGQNANTRAILDKLCQMEANAKDEKIAELTAINADLRLKASQEAQNSYLIDKLGYHMPVASYQVPNPYCNCNNGCGCM